MNDYMHFSENIIKSIEGTSLIYIFPIITIIGCGVLFYFAYTGIFLKKTINLYHVRGTSFSDSQAKYNGKSAVVFGIIYLILGILIFSLFAGINLILIQNSFA